MSDRIDASMSEFDVPPDVEVIADEDYAPLYRVDPETKIAVSKKYGGIWKSRIDASIRNRQSYIEAGEECVQYFNNNQHGHREGGGEQRSGNRFYSKRRNNVWSETENVVYSNTKAMMPAVYAKNPQVTFSTRSADRKPFIAVLEKLINTLMAMSQSPGLNMRMHGKLAVLSAELTNDGWIHYGYAQRTTADQAVQEQLAKLSLELETATDVKAIRIIEGKLMALEEEISVVQPAGPWVRYVPFEDVVVDAGSTMPDYSDSSFMAVKELYPTEYLNAKYGRRDSDDPNAQVLSLYEPTDVLIGGGDSGKDEGDNFKLFNSQASAHSYGYEDEAQLRKAYRTACWRIYDRTTRRVFLYACNKMSGFPIWVVNDPYGLPNFFPLRCLRFNQTTVGNQARSPVTYYLDQQDAINEIHSEYRYARQDIRENVLYDARMNKEAVEAWLNGGTGTAKGVELPDGMKLTDAILEKPNAMLRAMPLFDLERPFKSIDRVSGVSDVMRNEQYKTNTTNKAIEQYNSNTGMRLDEKLDEIENFLGYIAYDIAFMCAQFMTNEDVAGLLGADVAAEWQVLNASDLRNMFTCQAVGGSTQKPTSQAKQAQAIQLAEVLAKFVQMAPKTAIINTLKMLQEAFTEMVLPDGTFEEVAAEVTQMAERGNSVQGGGGGGGGAASTGEAGGGSGPEQLLQQVSDAVDQLPPEAKRALGEAIAREVPLSEAVPQILQALSSNNTTQQ